MSENVASRDGEDVSEASGEVPRRKFLDSKFAVSIGILALLAIVSAYLEYVYYPSILVSNQFGEYGISLHLSFLTFQFFATRGAESVPGIPSLDFFQIFLIFIIGYSIWHYFDTRPKKAKSALS